LLRHPVTAAGDVRGRGARGPRPGGGCELRRPLHDRLPAASPCSEGDERGDGARAWRSRQGGHVGPRARSARRALPLRDYRKEDFLARGCSLPVKASTLCSTGLVARFRFAPSARCGRAERLSCSATPPRSCWGTGAGERGSSGTRRPRALSLGPGFGPSAEPRLPDRQAAQPPPGVVPEDFLALLELLRRGAIRPVVSERLPLTEVRRAHELLASSAATGKLVLVPEGAEDAGS
jgi:Zinc-binding dehydrogenase